MRLWSFLVGLFDSPKTSTGSILLIEGDCQRQSPSYTGLHPTFRSESLRASSEGSSYLADHESLHANRRYSSGPLLNPSHVWKNWSTTPCYLSRQCLERGHQRDRVLWSLCNHCLLSSYWCFFVRKYSSTQLRLSCLQLRQKKMRIIVLWDPWKSMIFGSVCFLRCRKWQRCFSNSNTGNGSRPNRSLENNNIYRSAVPLTGTCHSLLLPVELTWKRFDWAVAR